MTPGKVCVPLHPACVGSHNCYCVMHQNVEVCVLELLCCIELQGNTAVTLASNTHASATNM